MDIWQAAVLGVVEGVTEFLPVSSTGHLTITEKIMGIPIDDKGVTAFTAIIQVGAIIAAIIYFRADIGRFIAGFVKGVASAEGRKQDGWRMAINVIIGSVPIAVVGLLFKDLIEGALRSLWFVAGALVVWSLVMVTAEHVARHRRGEGQVTWKDSLLIGLAQCIALVPGVSRSGATISAGLFRDLDRVTATRLSFFLGIPALAAAGALEGVQRAGEVADTVGWVPVGVGLVVSFVVAYASIAWLLKFVASHSIASFVYYRAALGGVIVALLWGGVVAAT
ncbi:undecaprenyl-diphosphate phosphatase [Dactylosporangium sp. AC04546]|uniref:undecaprenyl-diphosphate phosphatase n=1 Tax=Dactylosporangium sp. AC04546 TaxID=2862460 RepID=UPI001EDCAD81|nr:undecaprenyl-diphosphate phosphatase [Dactylosporangium sp. AC04546]WVK86261.1 undecaprenyl-diphosphate phosphatase [Dactylosporangium sp. AC04546]